MRKAVKIGTRGSKLALVQSGFVKKTLEALFPGVEFSLTAIKTMGDVAADEPLVKAGGKGLFVSEIEEAMLRGEIDLAVHSVKDLPTEQPAGLVLAAVPPREDPRDVLVGRTRAAFRLLPAGAVLGTGSPRRASQLLSMRPDLRAVNIRGNVDTRLRKLERGDCDALVLAAAGLRRLGLASVITEYLDPDFCIPAVGQGAIGVEARADDAEARGFAAAMNAPEAMTAVLAERAFLARLGAGCAVPASAHARIVKGKLDIRGFVSTEDGAKMFRDSVEAMPPAAVEAGVELAEKLLGRGAQALLARLRLCTEIGD